MPTSQEIIEVDCKRIGEGDGLTIMGLNIDGIWTPVVQIPLDELLESFVYPLLLKIR